MVRLSTALILSLWLPLLPLAWAARQGSEVPPVRSVPAVDLKRYAGTWYELARLPNRFQSDCARDVTARYEPLADGGVRVTNRCRTLEGEVKTAEGLAVPTDRSNARLKVSFLPGWLKRLPGARGDYWVVLLDPQYRWAVVSEPRRENLWVLARSPALPPQELARIVDTLAGRGYPTDRLLLTPHDAADLSHAAGY
ncbi:lipocalin family protein [Aquabacterium sp. J223]|uniref:lipocalin family protein n=1 Tax=Aquabacterium sp. J223 TaxID=2898431 RepID=UPI0021ADB392|nr:lipocalin family protein [Aquabacterium sp. J223]UUX93951.1 lipocalin family protein [Aquabacterium sp. J223]